MKLNCVVTYGKNSNKHNFNIEKEDLDMLLDQCENPSIAPHELLYFPNIAIRKDQFISLTSRNLEGDE